MVCCAGRTDCVRLSPRGRAACSARWFSRADRPVIVIARLSRVRSGWLAAAPLGRLSADGSRGQPRCVQKGSPADLFLTGHPGRRIQSYHMGRLVYVGHAVEVRSRARIGFVRASSRRRIHVSDKRPATSAHSMAIGGSVRLPWRRSGVRVDEAQAFALAVQWNRPAPQMTHSSGGASRQGFAWAVCRT